ncbi:MAG: hypothetical protein KDK38_03935 [Leptospiraceae bacterium]|nr:hypothetical protein [Leptospiraceae bacterium]
MVTTTPPAIVLQDSPDFWKCLKFPLQSKISRYELFLGGLWMLVPVFGWLINMGHRIIMVHNLLHNQPTWPSLNHPGRALYHGCLTFAGMLFYSIPAFLCFLIAAYLHAKNIHLTIIALPVSLGIVCQIIAILAIPGYMTQYCIHYDAKEIFSFSKSIRRVFQAGRWYYLAWRNAFICLLLSFLGLLFFGLGFLWTSVWFWQVAGFSFAGAFAKTMPHKEKTISS